jgi:hypothetical protein
MALKLNIHNDLDELNYEEKKYVFLAKFLISYICIFLVLMKHVLLILLLLLTT